MATPAASISLSKRILPLPLPLLGASPQFVKWIAEQDHVYQNTCPLIPAEFDRMHVSYGVTRAIAGVCIRTAKMRLALLVRDLGHFLDDSFELGFIVVYGVICVEATATVLVVD